MAYSGESVWLKGPAGAQVRDQRVQACVQRERETVIDKQTDRQTESERERERERGGGGVVTSCQLSKRRRYRSCSRLSRVVASLNRAFV